MATMSGTQSNPKRMPVHLPVPWVYVLVYLFGVALQALAPVPSPISASPDVTLAAGLVTFSLGAAIAGWGWVTFHRAGTTKTPGERSTHLVTWGPYRFSRNPMYVGMAIAYVGEALLLRHVWPVLLLPLVLAYVNWVVIPVEQSVLQDVFGEGYREYQARVRRWL
jgi:protein-S-isoprenylcysteine O-methyltransferase Ste14